MTSLGDPVLQAITEAAVGATGAAQGCVLRADGEELQVVAAAGGDHPGDLLGVALRAGSGAAGFVVASGQPLALSPTGRDPRLERGVAGSRPTALLCVPCAADGVVAGALELVDKAGGGRFTFDDVEVATLLGGIAGVALARGGTAPAVPAPAELGAELVRLAAAHPGRYAPVAGAVAALVAGG